MEYPAAQNIVLVPLEHGLWASESRLGARIAIGLHALVRRGDNAADGARHLGSQTEFLAKDAVHRALQLERGADSPLERDLAGVIERPTVGVHGLLKDCGLLFGGLELEADGSRQFHRPDTSLHSKEGCRAKKTPALLPTAKAGGFRARVEVGEEE